MDTLPSGVTFFERGWLSSNNVLIQDHEQAILVDSGYWTHSSQTAALVSAALQERPLTTLINTHLHSDHCGGNAHLQTVFPQVQTLIPPGQAFHVDAWDADALTYTPTGQHCPPFQKTDVLHDGDCFVVAGKTWRIHAAPGHDPHSIVIFSESDKVLISADALWGNGFGVVFPEIEGFMAFDEVASTLDIIERLNPRLVLPGHGSAFSDVSESLSRARTRLAQFRNAPEKHANYAAKVLLKFKLLEFQKIRRHDFYLWARSTTYMQMLYTAYAKNMSFDAWIFDLCQDLQKAGACTLIGEEIINI